MRPRISRILRILPGLTTGDCLCQLIAVTRDQNSGTRWRSPTRERHAGQPANHTPSLAFESAPRAGQ